MTFASQEAKQCLLKYLEERLSRGEEITQDSFLFTSKRYPGRPLVPDYISGKWVRIIIESGLDLKLTKFHVLHFDTLSKYFEAKCNLAGMDPIITSALMGKPEGLKNLYLFTGITDFKDSYIIDFLRKEYAKVVPQLSVIC